MAKNTGIPYEILIQQIFQAIYNQDQVKNISVQQNVTLQGITAKHQIDVYWEYELGEIVYKTIVQAKDWVQPVSQNQLLTFKAILDDLPSQPRGVFVTRTGYQSGAEQFAKANGIILYELREPTDEDMAGRVMTIHLRISVSQPNSFGIQPIFDQNWIVAERQRLGLAVDEHPRIEINAPSDQVFLLNEAGQEVGNFCNTVQSMFPADRAEIPPTETEHIFTIPTFIATGNPRFPRIKLLGVRATISISRHDEEVILRGADFIGFILRDVIADKTRLIDKQNRPIK